MASIWDGPPPPPGLFGDIDAALRRQARGAMSHTPVRRVTGREFADALQAMAMPASAVPVIGDLVGLGADAAMYAAKPEERTLGNYAMTALGALPFVPPLAGRTRGVLGDLVRRGKTVDVESLMSGKSATLAAIKRELGKGATEADVRHYIAQYNASLPVERGGLGLPISNTSRQRADAAGSGRDVTVHETATAPDAPIQAFNPSLAGTSTGADSARAGVFSHLPSERPADYDPRQGYGAHRQSQIPGSAAYSIPLVTRGRYGQIGPVADTTRERALRDYLAQAQEQGYDALRVSFSGTRQPEYVASNPNQLRLPWAAFDPAQRNSPNLLASMAPYSLGAGLLGGLWLTSPDAQAGQR